MNFASLAFVAFALVFFPSERLFPRRSQLRLAFLSFASLVFYGWGNPFWVVLLLISGGVDFAAALAIAAYPRRRRWILTGSLLAGLGLLVTFKYLRFLLTLSEPVLALVGRDWLPSWTVGPPLELPPGISFYTFQSISYTVDVYRGRIRPTSNPLRFFAYLALFPQLVAGPIVRADELLYRLGEDRRPDALGLESGLALVLRGYLKKLVIADNLAPYVDAAFANHSLAMGGAVYWWWTALLFAIQIYCDFSGYTDIARGLGRWIGIEFPENFRHPYASASFREYWSRWHITLSTWFRDYVYIPLGGSRVEPRQAHANLWATMLLSGLWHGASMHFVVWGAMHAAALSLERLVAAARDRWGLPAAPRLLGWAVVTIVVLMGWVMFRAEGIQHAIGIFAEMLGTSGPSTDFTHPAFGLVPVLAVASVAISETGHALGGDAWVLERCWTRGWFRSAALSAIALCCVFLRGPGHTFIYFQF